MLREDFWLGWHAGEGYGVYWDGQGQACRAALLVVLSPPIATRVWQIGFLIWLVAALAPEASFGPLAPVFAWAWLPLLPIVACYNFGQMGVVGRRGC